MIPSRSRPLALALLAASALTGCNGGADPIPIDELAAEVQHRLCARAAACGGAESQESCEATAFYAQNFGLLTLIAAVDRGTIAYDGVSAAACLAPITTNCARLPEEPDACDHTFRGTVAAGGVCVIDNECAGGGECAHPDTCTLACCAGTCQAAVPRGAVGAACDFTVSLTPCVDGAFCAGGTCTARRPPGAACGNAFEECAAPALCLFDSNGAGTCTVLSPQPGAPCVGSNNLCGRDDETCNAATSRCTKRARPGAACQSSSDCVAYAVCATTQTCTPRPTLGQACDDVAGTYCVGGLGCVNGICTAPPPGVACVP